MLNEKVSFRLECADGTVKIREFSEKIDYVTIVEELLDFLFVHIGHCYIFGDFSRATLTVKWGFDVSDFVVAFEDLEDMRNYYVRLI